MSLSPSYVYSREMNLKVKVVDENGRILQKIKIGVDRDTITFERLRFLLTQRLRLRRKFTMRYLMKTQEDDRLMLLTDDWDLDVALQQRRHSLNVFIEVSDSDAGSSDDGLLTSPVESLQLSSRSSRSSVLDRLIDKVDGWLTGSFDDTSQSKAPMTFREFQNYLDCEGRIVNYQGFRESIYLGGVAPSMRKIAWRHLLCVFPEDMTADERIEFLKAKSEQYVHMRDEWKRAYEEMGQDSPEQMKFVITMVRKDVVRTDRNTAYYKGKDDNKHTMSLFHLLCTYALYHPTVSYCQGMCDLASPLLAVQDNEAHAYLLFCSLMERMKCNFSYDSTAITTKFSHLTQLLLHFDSDFYNYLQNHQLENLLFAYRWLLLEMKREFSFEDSCYFTEVMWSSLPTLPTVAGVSLRPFNSPPGFDISYCNLLLPCHLDSDTASTCTNTSSAMNDLVECGSSSATQTTLYDKCELQTELDEVENDTVFGNDNASEFGSDEITLHEELFDGDLESTGVVDASPPPPSTLMDDTPTGSMDEAAKEDFSGIACDQRQGSSSVDSGFGSRSGSPTRTDRAALVTAGHLLSDESVQLFPPPKLLGYGNPFLMFAALAMLLEHRHLIMGQNMDFNDIVMLFTGYKNHRNVHAIVKEAKQLYEAYIVGGLEPDEDEFEKVDDSIFCKHAE
ncbi:TBC1 domain family member 25-like [Watersipora subatra]|uniref:TBC1 domain family member 25-like n=1 Tax=Watersipora subatra TaxID=2589382 RepID=UPI00355BFB5B